MAEGSGSEVRGETRLRRVGGGARCRRRNDTGRVEAETTLPDGEAKLRTDLGVWEAHRSSSGGVGGDVEDLECCSFDSGLEPREGPECGPRGDGSSKVCETEL